MTTKNCFLEENHSLWVPPPIAEAAQGLQVPAPQQPTLPSVFRSFPSPSPLFFQCSNSARQPESRELAALPQHLPPGPQSRLPSPGRCLQPPDRPGTATGTGTRRLAASPCPGHARKLCLTLQTAQPLGTKNRPCARLDVFLSAGYTPSSSRSIFSIGGTA